MRGGFTLHQGGTSGPKHPAALPESRSGLPTYSKLFSHREPAGARDGAQCCWGEPCRGGLGSPTLQCDGESA